MKKILLSFNLILSLSLFGQSVVIVPNTEDYNQNGIVYSNSLFLGKNYKLKKFDGQIITDIPNPSYNNVSMNGTLAGNMVIYDNKLCYNYKNGSAINNDYIITYDGSSQNAFLKPISQPSINIGDNGDDDEPVISGGKLFLRGSYFTGIKWLAFLYVFDGQNLTMIKNFGSNVSGEVKLGNWAVSNNNQLYLGYIDGIFNQLIKFNGTDFTSLTNSSKEYLGGVISSGSDLNFYYNSIGVGYGLGIYSPSTSALSLLPVTQSKVLNRERLVTFNSKIYGITYDNGLLYRQLTIFEGANFQKINNLTSSDLGPSTNVTPFNGDLYFGYKNTSNKIQLGKYAGTNISLVPNPSVSDKGIGGKLIEFNGKLFFTYKINTINYLAMYDGQALTILPNPDNGEGVIDNKFVVYGNDLYFPYKDATGKINLAKYGTTFLNTKEVNKKITNISIFKEGNGFSAVSKIKEISKIEILDISGRQINNIDVNATKYYFEMSAAGVFIIKVTLKDGEVFTQKIKN
ncbi:hypothetical protein [Chryseobacterium sp. IT-36CA2]|uniref:hypothetical protein n=1 Tax=Chryseobacterium sp. IT-36CA2 TaxID=3026460 RepID=UPI0039E01E6E